MYFKINFCLRVYLKDKREGFYEQFYSYEKYIPETIRAFCKSVNSFEQLQF